MGYKYFVSIQHLHLNFPSENLEWLAVQDEFQLR